MADVYKVTHVLAEKIFNVKLLKEDIQDISDVAKTLYSRRQELTGLASLDMHSEKLEQVLSIMMAFCPEEILDELENVDDQFLINVEKVRG